jgi:hypothetical protein
MPHRIIFDDFDVTVNNHSSKDYDIDLTSNTIQKDRKKDLKSKIINEIMDADVKKFPLDKRKEIVSNIIQFYTGYSIDSEENNKMVNEFITSYYWLFK